jgi:drug/metabolite transporter (DMT)-like permease
MLYIISAWIASFIFGLSVVIGKIVSKYSIKNMWYFNFLYVLFTFLFMIPFSINKDITIPILWTNLLLSSFFDALSNIFFTLSIFHLDVSVMGPLFNLRTAFSAILAVLLLGEVLSSKEIILIIIIFFAGMFVSISEKFSIKSFFNKSIYYGILMSLFLAFKAIFVNKSIANIGLWNTNFFNPLFSFIFTFLTIPFFFREIKKTKIKNLLGVVLSTFAVTLGIIFSNFAYKENVSISSVIISLPFSLIIVFIISLIKPKLLEKHTLKVYTIRFLCAFIMMGAALKLSI